jgi:nucleoid DNA-binding protein
MAVKSDMAEFIRENARCTWGEAAVYADLAVRWLAGTIAAGERVELRGLGTFYTVERAAAKSNLPTAKQIPKHRKIKFKPGKTLDKALRRKL